MTPTTSFTTRCRSALRAGEGWTRREFLCGAAGVLALPHLQAAAVPARQFAYVASGVGSLHVFSAQDEQWTEIQRVASRAPACVLLSPSQRILYVANAVEMHQGLPCGTVEAFQIDAQRGSLTLLSRQPLSLSATQPRHMALSPDGKLLAVAAYGGGIYNLFPLQADGSLGRPDNIFKDAGCGPHSTLQAAAHPHTLLFDAGGRHLLSSDFGSDRLSVFAVEEGRLWRRMQRSTGAGSGPGACVLHPSGAFFYAWHDLEGTLACYRYHDGTVGETIQRLSFPGSVEGALAIHPSGRALYSSQGVWRIDAENGRLARAQDLLLGSSQITVAHDGECVFTLDGARRSIYEITANRITGELHSKTKVAQVDQPKSIAFKTA
jgi:6-phosphogluconolactonase